MSARGTSINDVPILGRYIGKLSIKGLKRDIVGW